MNLLKLTGRARVFLSAVSRKFCFIIDSDPQPVNCALFSGQNSYKGCAKLLLLSFVQMVIGRSGYSLVAGRSQLHNDFSYFAGEEALGRGKLSNLSPLISL